MTTALEGVRAQRHAPAAFTPGKDPLPIVQEAGWAPGPVRTGAENLASYRDSIPGLSSSQRVAIPTELPGPRSETNISLPKTKQLRYYKKTCNCPLWMRWHPESFGQEGKRWTEAVAYRGGFGGFNPPLKFLSFDKVEPDCKLSGKCLVFLFQHGN